MFVVCRKLAKTNRSCVLICHSERHGKKVVQKTIKYFGVAHNEEQRKMLVDEAKKTIDELHKSQKKPVTKIKQKPPERERTDHCGGALLGHTIERHRVTEGFHVILCPIFDALDLSPLLTAIRYRQLRDVVIARIAQPTSKLRTAQVLRKTFMRPLSEDQIYRLMDELVELEDVIQSKVFEATTKLIGNKTLNLLLFDVTTLYFESQDSDELREFGYSKDHKIGETQVVLALATTETGAPIGYHLFRGNMAEVNTLLTCLEKWKTVVNIAKIVIVADRAMMSEANLAAMEQAGLTYVIAAKLRSLPQKLKRTILDKKMEISNLGDDGVCIQEYDRDGRRLIVEYSANRAHKDAKDRERLIQKVRRKLDRANKIDPQKLVTNRGYLKFLDREKNGVVVLNEDKIIEDQRWDGLHGVITNDQTSKPLELLARYSNLWVIEESFRISKHTLAMRPIYHFTPRRIRAHVLICYLAFAVIRYAHQRINVFDESCSIGQMRDALAEVEVSILEDLTTGCCYKVPSPLSKEAKMIYKAMGIVRDHRPSRYSELKNVV